MALNDVNVGRMKVKDVPIYHHNYCIRLDYLPDIFMILSAKRSRLKIEEILEPIFGIKVGKIKAGL